VRSSRQIGDPTRRIVSGGPPDQENCPLPQKVQALPASRPGNFAAAAGPEAIDPRPVEPPDLLRVEQARRRVGAAARDSGVGENRPAGVAPFAGLQRLRAFVVVRHSTSPSAARVRFASKLNFTVSRDCGPQ
jgi:hypothetical protein